MAENILYILGAGFSAPLGIPTMNDFYDKSQTMLDENPEKYSHFNDIFKLIREMGFIQTYFNSDQLHIEEILSILVMKNELFIGEMTDNFITYIIDVIKHHTPEIKKLEYWGDSWFQQIFGQEIKWNLYGYFLANLMNLKFFRIDNNNAPGFAMDEVKKYKYSVITLNYDLIFENLIKYLNDNFRKNEKLNLNSEPNGKSDYALSLAKIHGSIDTRDIIPPTWNKFLSEKIKNNWRLAHKLISAANQIRIIGYSLPKSDAYITYLIKSAMIDSKHLKNIDVICRDENGDAKERYSEFIKFKNYKFYRGNTEMYLEIIRDLSIKTHKKIDELRANILEEAHKIFINNIIAAESGTLTLI